MPGPDWPNYLHLLERRRTPALAWAALNRVPDIAIPKLARKELERRSDACRMQAVRYCLLIAEVLKAFNRARIPAVSFKGQILSFELHGDGGFVDRETWIWQ